MKTYSIIQRNKSKGFKTWFLRTYDNETRTTTFKSLKTCKKHEAAELLHAAINGENESREQRNKKQFDSLNIETAFTEYIKHYETRNVSKLTILNNKFAINPFVIFCKLRGVELVKDISNNVLIDYFHNMNGAPNAKRKRHQQLKTFYKWILDFYDIEKKNIFTKVKPPKAETPIRFFWTVEQINKILEHTEDKQRRFFYSLMAFEGLRFTEAKTIKWEQIKQDKIEVVGKGKKFASIPLSNRMKCEISELDSKKDSGKILSKHFFNTTENRILKELCSRLFPEDKTPVHLHRFRHSFGSNLIKEGASIVAVSKLMRHENANITLKYYAHVLDEDLAEAINKL